MGSSCLTQRWFENNPVFFFQKSSCRNDANSTEAKFIQCLNNWIIRQTISPLFIALLQTVILHNFNSHTYSCIGRHPKHLPEATRNYRQRDKAVSDTSPFYHRDLAAVLEHRCPNRRAHTHTCYFGGVCALLCSWHGLWPLTWPAISKAAGEVWLKC